MGKLILPEEKIALTLKFLALGEIFHSLMYQYQVHRLTIGEFLPVVCNTIYHCLKDKYLNIASTSEERESIEEETNNRWLFSSVFIAADGKLIVLFYQSGSGSEF